MNTITVKIICEKRWFFKPLTAAVIAIGWAVILVTPPMFKDRVVRFVTEVGAKIVLTGLRRRVGRIV